MPPFPLQRLDAWSVTPGFVYRDGFSGFVYRDGV